MLGAFMSGLASGAESTMKLFQQAEELRMQMDTNALLREGDKTRAALEDVQLAKTGAGSDYGGGGTGPSSTEDQSLPRDYAYPQRDFAIPTTGSGDGGGGTERSVAGSTGAGGWGVHAKTVIDTLKGLGWKDGAIQGALANGLAEGGFKDQWVGGDNGNSRGHFQYYAQGEMPGYLKWAGANGVTDPHDTAAQTQYLAKRMEEIHPGFGQIDNPYDATDIIGTRFERYKGAAPGQRYGQLATAQKFYGQPNYGIGATAQPSTIAGPQLRVGLAGPQQGQPAPGYGPLPAPVMAVGGGIGGTGQPASGYTSAPQGYIPPAPTQALVPPAAGDNRGMLAPNDPNYQQWVKEQIASGKMPPSASTVGKPEGLDKRVRKTAALGDIYGGALA